MAYILLVLWRKELLKRRNHFVVTALEVLIPILILLTQLLEVPEHTESIDSGYMSNIVSPNCSKKSLPISVIYEPNTSATTEFMSQVKCLTGISDIKPGLIDWNYSNFTVGVKFGTELTADTSKLSYKIYPRVNYVNNTDELWKKNINPGASNRGQLITFLLQYAIDYSFLTMKNITPQEITFQTTTVTGYSTRPFTLMVKLIFWCACIVMLPVVVSRLSSERNSGAKELMLMMGVKRWHLWCVKLLDLLIVNGLIMGLVVLFLYVPITRSSHVLSYVHPVITWCIIMYGLLAIIIFLFFLSNCFQSVLMAVMGSLTVFEVALLLYSALDVYTSELTPVFRFLWCLVPHIAFVNGLGIVLDYDFYGKSVKLNERLGIGDNYLTLSEILIMMTVDILIYSILTWFTEETNPGPFGVPKPFFFLFLKSYWFRTKPKPVTTSRVRSEGVNENFESVPAGLEVGISVINVKKKFKTTKDFYAVNDVSLNFHRGEITALLGHAGAGKTTLISIITGFVSPTSGKVLINGYDVAWDSKSRKSLGLCPQADMLFSDMNPIDILVFYGMVKGLSKKRASKETDQLIKRLKLEKVKKTVSSRLSGGQKRKVSLGIALIGGSEILILDEPTSGMDPEIRREIWEILLDLRGTKTVLLTTHFMEEADVVSDRIAIMMLGRVACYGTPMYLKSKFGFGYSLSVVIKISEPVDRMTSFIQRYVKDAKLKSVNITTLMYELPESDIDNFPSLLSALSDRKKRDEIKSYSMAFTTLEDVFLRVGDGARRDDEGIFMEDRHLQSVGSEMPKRNDLLLYMWQIYALFVKKFIFFRRKIITFCAIFFCAIMLAVLQLFLIPLVKKHNEKSNIDKGDLVYSLSLYRDSQVLYSSISDTGLSETFEKIVKDAGPDIKRVQNVKKGIKEVFLEDFCTYSKKLTLSVEFLNDKINVFHNFLALHILPIGLNVIHNSFLKVNDSESGILTTVSLKYMDRSAKETAGESCYLENLPDLAILPGIIYLLATAKEREFGAKHLQLMSVPTHIYWLTHLIFDTLISLIFISIIVILCVFSDVKNLIINNIGDVYLGLFLVSVSYTIIAYLFSAVIIQTTASYIVFLLIIFFPSLIVYNLAKINLWPEELIYLSPATITKWGYLKICLKENDNYKIWLIVYDVVLYVILILIHSHGARFVFHRMISLAASVDFSKKDNDPRVKEQEDRVKRLISDREFSDNPLIVYDLRRWYCTCQQCCNCHPAVRGISFSVGKGECFGLLGVNGAGKTTTFNMLTGVLSPSGGKAFVEGKNLFSLVGRTRRLSKVGYCPQYTGLIPEFTSKEILILFARLRGVPESHIKQETSNWIVQLDLLDHIHTRIHNYSGGNKRKLAVAIALIGSPPVIFLDEPTSGVDPGARRAIWKVISKLRSQGKCVVLTSHSMDECETFCTRLAIMVNGQIRCLGEIPTLKNLFGQGYTVQLKLSANQRHEDYEEVKAAMSSNFDPGCRLSDEHLTILQYHITNENIDLSEVFSRLIKLKKRYGNVESFTAVSTSLEEIFIYFARNR